MKTIRRDLNIDFFCPVDQNRLGLSGDRAYFCNACGKKYPVEKDAIIHFIANENERPRNGIALAKDYEENSPERLSVEYYQQKYKEKERSFLENADIQSVVQYCAQTSGIVVDVASGHGGGFLPWLAPRLKPEVFLIGTDMCLPVIYNWIPVIQKEHALFLFLDVDLLAPLPFPRESIDLFTGVAISNVGFDNSRESLRLLAECLSPQGSIVLLETFYDPESVSAEYLRKQCNPYASVHDYGRCVSDFGLRICETRTVKTGIGKVDLRDGFPLADTDKWFENLLIIRRV